MTPEEARKLEFGHKVLGRNGVRGIVTRITRHSFVIQWEDGNEDLYGFESLCRVSVAEDLQGLKNLR
jgi:hypothetical protein